MGRQKSSSLSPAYSRCSAVGSGGNRTVVAVWRGNEECHHQVGKESGNPVFASRQSRRRCSQIDAGFRRPRKNKTVESMHKERHEVASCLEKPDTKENADLPFLNLTALHPHHFCHYVLSLLYFHPPLPRPDWTTRIAVNRSGVLIPQRSGSSHCTSTISPDIPMPDGYFRSSVSWQPFTSST